MKIKHLYLLMILATAMIFTTTRAMATTLLDNTKWTKATGVIGAGSQGNLQGAAFLPAALNGIDGKDRIYIFKQGSNKSFNSCDYYEPATNTWTVGLDQFTWAQQIHMGSACFGPSVLTTYTDSEGHTYHCSIPFVYVTGHCTLDQSGQIVTTGGTRYITCAALDLENQRIVCVFAFPDRNDDCIMTFDWAGNRLWVIGYTQSVTSGKAPYVIDEYRRVDMTDFLSGAPTKWNYTDITPQQVVIDEETGGTSSTITVPATGPFCLRAQDGGPDADGIQHTLECGTVQDCFYHNDHIYIVTGRGSMYNRTECVKIHGYCVQTNRHRIEKTVVTPLHGESQGLVFDGTNIWVTVSGTGEGGLYKVAPRAAGDNSYDALNYKEANEITPATTPATYAITCGEELVWWLQQVYAGRTDIQAVLQCDIDMTGIHLPTSYYIYEKPNASGNRTFEAQYAFRGIFDGQGHTISNLAISSTPFDNDGLFPWIIGATVKDVTVEGNITLTAASHADTDNQYAIKNVGLIGTAEGECTITGVNVAELTISNPSNLTTAYVDTDPNGVLVGYSEGRDYSTGNTLPQDHTNGHIYNADGVCVATGTCDAHFQPAALVDGVYEIGNAGQLYWFANAVNAGTATTHNARLISDINLRGSKYGEFPGINVYTGTFDGQGYTIRNFSMDKTDNLARTGMFLVAEGSAVIRRFTLIGKRNLGGSQNMHGAVVGSLKGSALVEDVISEVDLTSSSTLKIIGGVVGAVESASARVNRCTYSGTITIGTSIEEIGGIAGNLRGGTLSNCLFSGTIVSTSGSADLCFGGIAGSTSTTANSKILNCFACGTLSISGYQGTKSGIVFGAAGTTLTIANTYYTTTSVSGISDAVGTGTAAVSGIPSPVADAAKLTNGQLLFNLQRNAGQTGGQGQWTAGDSYPVPGLGALAPEPEGARFTIVFRNWDNTQLSSEQLLEGDPIAAPTATRTGYTFTGWSPALAAGAVATRNQTYTAQFSINSYTISYYVDGALDGEADTYEYGATVTPREEPAREGYVFSGWSAIPATMPATNVRVDGTFSLPQTYTNGFNNNPDAAASLKYEAPDVENGYYIIDNGGKLFSFAQQINAGTIPLSSNVRITTDISLENREFPCIGASGKVYTGTFDGNNKTISDYKYTCASTANGQGFFNYTGAGAVIKDFTLLGEMIFNNASYKPAFLGAVVGSATGTTISNVTSAVNFTFTEACNGTATSGIRILGGIAGSSNGSTISSCRYSGKMSLNGSTAMGDRFSGIVGDVRSNTTTIRNCLFDGTIENKKNSIAIGGILGKKESGTAKIENCLSVGTLKLQTVNTNCGMIIAYSGATVNNSYYTTDQFTAAGSAVTSGYNTSGTEKDRQEVLDGRVCALLNQNSAQWSQILGYQTGNTPAQAYPVPGTAYPVSKNGTDYTVAYYAFDDLGDYTNFPADAASITAQRISYTRSSDYMTSGYISVCMPFALTDDLLPGGEDCIVKVFDRVEDDLAYFRTVEDHDALLPGVPYFIYLPEAMRGQEWTIEAEGDFSLALAPVNPESGILGQFNTTVIGQGFYKLNRTGDQLLRTVDASVCYPYRGYLQLPVQTAGQARYRVSFIDSESSQEGTATGLEDLGSDANAAASIYAPDAQWYNVLGQQVDHHATGLIICRGQKYYIR